MHIKQLCSFPSEQPIVRSKRIPDLVILTRQLQKLLTYGEPTSDAILSLYCEGLATQHNLAYLSTTFINDLQQKKWARVKKYFAMAQTSKSRRIDRPHMQGEAAIMIPTFINSNHWVALVRREVGESVYFLYSDDLNDIDTEHKIQDLIFNHTDSQFCPKGAQWINCHSTTFYPHSNECGPRTILALHIMALHPYPNSFIILPLMHPNLAQLSRAWIAAALCTGMTDTQVISQYWTLTPQTDTRISNRAQSIPFEVIYWNDQITSTQSQQSVSSQTLVYSDSHNSQTSTGSHIAFPAKAKETNKHNIQENTTEYTPSHLHPTVDRVNAKITQWIPLRQTESPTTSPETPTPLPFGTPLQSIDPTKTLRVIMQNTQMTFQLTNSEHKKLQAIENLHTLHTSVFVAISPNINWHNPSHWVQFKAPFKHTNKQIHISATSSDIGKTKECITRHNLIGGAAIISFNHWASKVCHTQHDPRGHGTFTVTTYQGKNGKKLSIIGAYISVIKGSAAGDNTLYHQQITLMEKQAIKDKTLWKANKCPRKEAILAIGSLIKELQEKDHAIILAIDANQTPQECRTKGTIGRASIEWLRLEHGLDDPFLELMKQRPPTTTKTPNRDIDYILTYQVPIRGVSTLEMDNPVISDHLGIMLDVDIAAIFASSYSELGTCPPP